MPVETTSHPPEAAPPSGPARRGLTDGGRRAALVTLAVAVVVLGLGAWAVGDGQPLPGEVGTVEAWNRLPAAVGWPLRAIMQLGTLWAGLAAVAAAAWWCRRVGMLAPAALLLSVAVAYRLDNVLKDLIERPRPYDVLPDLVARDHVGGFAYPSGHTTMAVAIVAALHPILPRRGQVVAWTLAALVAVARLHVGAHWPLDLVGGAALGLTIAAAAWLVVDRLPRCWFAPPDRTTSRWR
ncbi:MAG: phosphatase PAP2 family protein [Actinomycetota bacterium]